MSERKSYRFGDIVRHPIFGVGVVTRPLNKNLYIAFGRDHAKGWQTRNPMLNREPIPKEDVAYLGNIGQLARLHQLFEQWQKEQQ